MSIHDQEEKKVDDTGAVSPPHRDHDSFVMSHDEEQTSPGSGRLRPNNDGVRDSSPPRSSEFGGSKQAILQIQQFIAQNSTSTNTWLQLSLTPDERDEVVAQFEDDPEFRDYRYDYFFSDFTFVMGKESPAHSYVCGGVGNRVETEITKCRRSACKPVRKFAKKLHTYGRGTIKLEGLENTNSRTNSHTPDATIAYRGAKYPPVVIEVAHSQKKSDLPKLANDYLIGSLGNTVYFVGLKTTYRRSEPATISVWKAVTEISSVSGPQVVVQQTVNDEVICTADGVRNPQCPGLSLCLAHMASNTRYGTRLEKVSKKLPKKLTTFHLSAEKLYGLLQEADEEEEASESGWVANQGVACQIPGPSEEESSSEDESSDEETQDEAEGSDYVE